MIKRRWKESKWKKYTNTWTFSAGNTCYFNSVIQLLANTKSPTIETESLTNRFYQTYFLNLLNEIFKHILSGNDVKKEIIEEIFSFITI